MHAAVRWIKDGWVTVVTGKGRGCNHTECQARLATLKEINQILQYHSSCDSGALYVQLKACDTSFPVMCGLGLSLRASGPPPSASSAVGLPNGCMLLHLFGAWLSMTGLCLCGLAAS